MKPFARMVRDFIRFGLDDEMIWSITAGWYGLAPYHRRYIAWVRDGVEPSAFTADIFVYVILRPAPDRRPLFVVRGRDGWLNAVRSVANIRLRFAIKDSGDALTAVAIPAWGDGSYLEAALIRIIGTGPLVNARVRKKAK